MKDPNLFTNYKKVIGSKNVILLAPTGSDILGLASADNSDRDEMGIALESPADALGFAPFDRPIIYRTAEDRTGKHDEPSKPGDIDLTIYGLRHFLKLALGGNPNIINLLFTPEDKLLLQTFIGSELQALAPKIVSKQAGKAFLGYLKAQRLRLVGARGQKRVNRPALEEVYGFDTKYARHMLRLGLQGVQLMTHGKLELPLPEANRKFLTDASLGKNGLNFCLEYATLYEDNIEKEMLKGDLRSMPDYAGVEEWFIKTCLDNWKGQRESASV